MKFANTPNKRKRLATLIIVLFMFSAAVTVYAVNDNNEKVPWWIRINMLEMGQGSYKGQACGDGARKFNHAQWSWLSQKGNNEDQSITVTSGQDTADLWYSVLSAHCDSIINSSTKRVTDRTLKETRTTVLGATTNNSNVTVSWPAANRKITLDYAESYSKNDRYIKRSAPSEYPEFADLQLKGLNNLAPRDEPYKIEVTVNARMVHRYNNGTNYYRCVADADFRPVDSLDETSCPVTPVKVNIEVNKQSAYDGGCSIAKINGIDNSSGKKYYLTPGEKFDATFIVGNSGTAAWVLADNPATPAVESQVKLGTWDGLDNMKWGINRVKITGDSFGGGVQSAGKFSPPFSAEFTVDKDLAPGSYKFTWRLVKSPDPKITKIGTECSADIIIRQNKPILRASGGDVVSGVDLSAGTVCDAMPNRKSLHADIRTNGEWNGSRSLSTVFNGASSGQYGVFASGFIGGNDLPGNNFLGNNARDRDEANSILRKDLLFSNTGDGEYGEFYGTNNNSVPCISFSDLVNPVEPISSADASFRIEPPANGRKVMVVTGDVNIDSNIEYQSSIYSEINQIPNLVVLVQGNIYIKDTVTRLDGTYISIPKDGSGGIIDTCYKYAPGALPDAGADGLSAGRCANKLTVNGRLIAKNILFKRTYGSTGTDQSTVPGAQCPFNTGQDFNVLSTFYKRLEDCAAEFINMTPEVYFNGPGDNQPVGSNGVSNVPLTSIELPPIY